MKIFEDLIEELKKENLLESTDVKSSKYANSFSVKSISPDLDTNGNGHGKNEKNNFGNTDENLDQEFKFETVVSVEDKVSEKTVENKKNKEKAASPKEEIDEVDFYKQRAIDEVTGLQMVEHVISGIEREQMKTISNSFNDLKVKQSLHNFLKIEDPKSPEHAQAEFHLMQETEDWYSLLSRRDRNIIVAQFRRFCEQTKPPLSSRALMGLARFYRNSPFSETVRGKFDLVITRLFTKESGDDRRKMLFGKEEITQHIKELYADWSSVPLYPTQDDDPEILLCVLQFQDFVDEVDKAEKFDELIRSDLFNRIKVFKEKTSENFFCPQIVAAAIECNVAVGNRYVELIEREKNIDELGEKYGVTHDEAISEATGKTHDLIELIKEKEPAPVEEEFNDADVLTDILQIEENFDKHTEEISQNGGASKKTSKGINKLLLGSVFLILIFAGVYHFLNWNSDTANAEERLAPGVKKVNIEKSSLNEHLNKARISKDTFFAIAKPTWNQLGSTEKENYLKKIRSLGSDYKFNKIVIIDEKGAIIASAAGEKINSGT